MPIKMITTPPDCNGIDSLSGLGWPINPIISRWQYVLIRRARLEGSRCPYALENVGPIPAGLLHQVKESTSILRSNEGGQESSAVFGDIRTRNILYDKDTDEMHLIDFDMTGRLWWRRNISVDVQNEPNKVLQLLNILGGQINNKDHDIQMAGFMETHPHGKQ